MSKLLTIALLSPYLLQSLALPAIAKSPPSRCRSPYSFDMPRLKPSAFDSQTSNRIKAGYQAEIAIEFLRANRLDRASQLNQTVRTQRKLTPASFAGLETIQFLEAGKVKAAIALLPKIDNSAYLEAISTQLRRTPLPQRAEWILAAVDQLKIEESYPNSRKLDWLLELARNYQASGNQTEALKVLDKARTQIKTEVIDSIRVADGYRRIGKVEIARSLLEPLRDRVDSNSIDSPMVLTEDLIRFGHQLALLGQSESAIRYLNQAEAKLPSLNFNAPLFYKELGLAYAAAGQRGKALELIKQISEDWARDRAYAELARQSAILGDDRFSLQALKLIQNQRDTTNILTIRLDSDRLSPDTLDQFDSDMSIFVSMVQIFAEAGKLETAQQVAALILDQWEKSLALATIVKHSDPKTHALFSAQLIDQMRSMNSKQTVVYGQLEVADTLIEVGDRVHSRTILDTLTRLAESQKNTRLKLALVDRYAKLADFNQANRLLESELPIFGAKQSLPPDSMLYRIPRPPRPSRSPIVQLLAAPEVLQIRHQIAPRLKQMKLPDLPPPIDPPVPSLELPNLERRNPEATRLLDLGTFARHAANARNFPIAFNLLMQIPDDYCDFKAELLAGVAQNAIEAGELEMATDALQRSDRLFNRAKNPNRDFVREQMIAIAKRYSERNQPKEAALLLESAVALLK